MERNANRMKRILIRGSIFLFLSVAVVFAQEPPSSDITPISREAYNAILQFYQYDAEIPLDAKIVQDSLFSEKKTREKIVFTGANDKRVPGYLELPETGSAPYPCILLLHGAGGSKNDWWENGTPYQECAKSLMESGYAVVALDAVFFGERIADNKYEDPVAIIFEYGWANRTRDMFLDSIVDYRRLLDYLATRIEIDIQRIGALGYSMGGQMTFLLTAVEPRVKAAVSCVVPPLSKTFYDVAAIPFSHQSLLSAIAPYNFAHAIRAPLLMLMGREDPFYSEEEAKQLYQLIPGSTKDLVLFDSGHILPEEWVPKAVSWFQSHLK